MKDQTTTCACGARPGEHLTRLGYIAPTAQELAAELETTNPTCKLCDGELDHRDQGDTCRQCLEESRVARADDSFDRDYDR